MNSSKIIFDPMEIALHNAYQENVEIDLRHSYNLIHEYPLGGKPPMMTHIFRDNIINTIIAAKGSPEAIINVSNFSVFEKEQINIILKTLTKDGHRVLGVA
ncbi:MAG: hypothetical protein WAT89_11785 [Candidatus Kapaibacterium sp.]